MKTSKLGLRHGDGVGRMEELRRLAGELEKEFAADAGGAFDSDITAVLAHDFLADGKAQAGAAGAFLGFEDRENAFNVFGRDAFAVVGDDDFDAAVASFPTD